MSERASLLDLVQLKRRAEGEGPRGGGKEMGGNELQERLEGKAISTS